MRPFLVRLLFMAALAAAAAAPIAAQIVPVRTVPVASGDQFLLLPGQRLGMGGVELAVTDSLADPWSLPGRAVLVGGSAFLASPTMYGISRDGGAGRTLPLAAVFRGRAWAGGLAVALQQVDNGRSDQNVFIDPGWWIGPPPDRLRDLSNRNLYARAFLGRRLGRGPWSAGVAASVAGLDAMDGVDLLYAGATDIRQSGSLADVRVGLHREGPRDRVDLTLVHNRVSMQHDVRYVEWVAVPEIDQPRLVSRLEVNEDQSRTWGGRVAWDRTLDAPGWRLGAAATVNRKTHPKIPNYEIQNIPRDPGETWAWDFGMGLSRASGPTLFAVDVVFQPIWSDTWQEADTTEVGTAGRPVPAGGRTIENDFFFTNVLLRAGFEYNAGAATAQVGLEARSYDYDLRQQDNLAGTVRDARESWMEWSPTVGAAYRFDDVELRYAGRVTTGTGQPGVALEPGAVARLEAAADFILAPSGPLTLQDARVVTHQISVRIPIR
ncbi:MAG: hypothetical protein RJQ04_02615 [Longimicrobiales bacterium]